MASAITRVPRALRLPESWLRSLALGRSEPVLMLALIALGLAAHGLNMFQYPAISRFDDEGTYVSQAWAILREHRLSPYAYFYDHAPAGWIALAIWMAVTGGPHAFGLAVDGGRTLMLLLHLASMVLLYRLARKLGCPSWAAAVATVLFTISPLAVYYQRPVLLDNFMVFWVLVSLDMLLDDWGRLSRVALSGCCFGIGILSKETAVFLLPAAVFLAAQQRQQHHGRFALVGWVLPMAMVVSLYPLFALLRGELLPAGQSLRFFIFNIDTGPGLSLVDALRWQATRSGGGLLNLHNAFWTLVRTDWLAKDAVLFAGGAVASIVNLARGWRSRTALSAGLLGLLPLLYLARGGVVFDFYVLFAIPSFCLNIGVLLSTAAQASHRAASPSAGFLAIGALCGLAATYWFGPNLRPLYEQQPGEADREALSWVKQHVPSTSLMITGSDEWTDLHEPGLGGPAFPNVHSHWKAGADPAIRDGVFHDDWRTVDYLLISPQTQQDIVSSHITLAQQALSHAHLVRQWSVDGTDLSLWKVDRAGVTEQSLLQRSAAYMERRFAHDGAFASADGRVTSESQGYALLRAVWQNDKAAFDQTWKWTASHLVGASGLPAWLWQGGRIADAHTASDADTDTALALLLGGRQWHDSGLIDAGRTMAASIWAHDVATVNGTPYMTGGDWAPPDAVIGLNPSYFAPYAYRVFAQADAAHPWMRLVDSSYQVLFDASSASLGKDRSAGLPPDWIGLDRVSGKLAPLDTSKGDLTKYSYDAARVYWRIALDHQWSGDGRATSLLQQAGFLRDEVQRNGAPGAAYQHDGTPLERSPSVVGDAGAIAALLTLDPSLGNQLYAAQIVGGASGLDASTHWASPDDLYAQEWGWFAVALYSGDTPNTWNAPAAAGP